MAYGTTSPLPVQGSHPSSKVTAHAGVRTSQYVPAAVERFAPIRNGAGCPMEWTPGLRFPDTKLLVTGSLVRVTLLGYVLTVPDCGHLLRTKVAGAAFLVRSIVLLRRRTMLTASIWMLQCPLHFLFAYFATWIFGLYSSSNY